MYVALAAMGDPTFVGQVHSIGNTDFVSLRHSIETLLPKGSWT